MLRVSKRLLDAFNNWFVSDSGVWQTLGACLAVVAVEFSDPKLDPHAFLLMAVLTVYSAITQPALARAGRVSGDQQQQMLTRIQYVESQNAELLEHLLAIRDQQNKPADTGPTINT